MRDEENFGWLWRRAMGFVGGLRRIVESRPEATTASSRWSWRSRWRCFFVILLIAGCGEESPRVEARAVLDTVYERIGEGDYEGALAFYSESFLRSTPPEDWIELLMTTNRYFGRLESYEVVETRRRFDERDESRSVIVFECRVRYAKDSVREEVSLMRVEEGGGFEVSSHLINPALIPRG